MSHTLVMESVAVALVVCVIVAFVTLYFHRREGYGGCAYQWDSGFVCPPTVRTAEYVIQPYDSAHESTQALVSQHMQQEWGYGNDFIKKNWSSSGDTYFIMMPHDGADFIGTVAVDRKNFYPFISQLYVNPGHRRKGHATTLLQFAEDYGALLGFDSSRLWCKKHMEEYYAKRGYETTGKAMADDNTPVLVMVKSPKK